LGDYSREEIVRRQLGVATQLFIDNLDPISIHCLACSAAEHASFLAHQAVGKNFNKHVLETFPDRVLKENQRLRNQYWTPIKHSGHPTKGPFDLSERLAGFDDQTNDHMLFIVWHDYSAAGFPLPLEVQCFQVWYYGMYPEKLLDHGGFSASLELFGSLNALTRTKQKQRLKEGIDRSRAKMKAFPSPRTDPRALVFR
jgi:hypothetical protein